MCRWAKIEGRISLDDSVPELIPGTSVSGVPGTYCTGASTCSGNREKKK